jgi:acetylornithine deacetylase/succinyl-diaminopimelate desuccinylase-like protein
MRDRRPLIRFAFASLATALLGSLAVGVAVRATEDSATSRPRILADIQYLAADEREGRGIGTRGLDHAADYVRDQFQKAGLKPGLADLGFFQNFDMIAGRRLDDRNSIQLRGPGGKSIELSVSKDFVPLKLSASGTFTGPLVFAGYGITAPEYTYDDYAGIDVKGKVVLIMRHEPGQSDKADPHLPFGGNVDTKYARFDQKALNAAKHGAAAVIYVSAPHALKDQPDKLMNFGQAEGSSPAKIPQVQLARATADAVLQAAIGKDLAQIDAAIEKDMKPQTSSLDGWNCSGEITIREIRADVKNVLGVLDGAGPNAKETIVVGAHYDHWGYGGEGSAAPGSTEIHNGADDNASGTAGIIELARRLARREKPLDRRILFAAFTAEERGLIGSEHYVNNPAVPLDQTVAMINFDMIGRLREDKLIVYGTGTAPEFTPLLEKLNQRHKFSLRPIATGQGPSDQTSFYLKDIPVLHFFTDSHPDYHKPTDDTEKISIEGVDRVVTLVEALIVELASAESRPSFVRVKESPGQGDPVAGERAWLGSIPAFGEEVDGTLLTGVTAGSPADKAGIRGGDIIVQVGESEIHSLQDLQDALVSHKPGDVVKITVRRANVRITYPVTLSRRQQQ